MTKEEFQNLRYGKELLHMRYGPCKVLEQTGTGVVVKFLTDVGKRLFAKEHHLTVYTPALETDPNKLNFITKESVSQFGKDL